MYRKCAVVLAFLVAVIVAAALAAPGAPPSVFAQSRANSSVNGSHNLIVGKRVYGDKLVYLRRVYQPPIWKQIVTKVINVTTGVNITSIFALDRELNRTGAYPTILQGGITKNNFTIKFTSQRNHSIDFMLEVYGK